MVTDFTCDELWYLYNRTYADYKLSIVPTSTEFLKDLSDKLRQMHEDLVYPKEDES